MVKIVVLMGFYIGDGGEGLEYILAYSDPHIQVYNSIVELNLSNFFLSNQCDICSDLKLL